MGDKVREQFTRDVEKEVLEASFKYLIEHGLENTSMRDLCKGTGISSGSMYYWFDSKDDIVIKSAEYGLAQVVDKIFEYALEEMFDLKNFFDSLIDEINRYKLELRFIYQVATSPVYGETIRSSADSISFIYEKYIIRLSKLVKVPFEDLKPIVFMVIATILDYIVWDDCELTKGQIEYLYGLLKEKIEK